MNQSSQNNWDLSEGQTHYCERCQNPTDINLQHMCGIAGGVGQITAVPPTKGVVTAENLEEHMNNLHGVDFHKLSLREEFRDNFLDTFPYRTRDIAEWQEKENIMNWFIGKHNADIQDMLDSELLKEEDTGTYGDRDEHFLRKGRNQLRAQFREMLTNLIK